MKGLRFVTLITGLWLAVAPAAPAQEGQKPKEETLAEAARRLRAQKGSGGSARVLTNDNLSVALIRREPGTSPSESQQETAEPAAETAPPAATSTPVTNPKDEAERAAAQRKADDAQARVTQLKTDLALLERDFDLARQQFYSNPAYANDSAGQRRLDQQQRQIDAKKLEIADAEAKLATAQADLKAIHDRLGPRPAEPLSADQWAARLRPLQQELTQVEAEIQRMRAQLPNSPAPAEGNDFTRNQIRNLEARRAELQRKISDIQDEARRIGAPAGWTRPPQ
jgi:predicted  nucleic acid-binding Zn-ribbon protein